MVSDVAEDAEENALWAFVVWAYALDGVEEACLALQDEFNADVVLVLFCVWLSYRGLGSADLQQCLGTMLDVSQEWRRNLVEPIRAARRSMKVNLEAAPIAAADRREAQVIRNRVKRCELDLERLQVGMLYRLVAARDDLGLAGPSAERKAEALGMLRACFSASGIALDQCARTHLSHILDAIFGAQAPRSTTEA